MSRRRANSTARLAAAMRARSPRPSALVRHRSAAPKVGRCRRAAVPLAPSFVPSCPSVRPSAVVGRSLRASVARRSPVRARVVRSALIRSGAPRRRVNHSPRAPRTRLAERPPSARIFRRPKAVPMARTCARKRRLPPAIAGDVSAPRPNSIVLTLNPCDTGYARETQHDANAPRSRSRLPRGLVRRCPRTGPAAAAAAAAARPAASAAGRQPEHERQDCPRSHALLG